MCGVTGLWELDAPFDLPTLDRFTDSLAHRGPDGRGTYVDEHARLGLGHRRLAILDLSEHGHQPMTYGDSDLWISFNGEIYNFVELRRELEGHGHRFRTETDTEVILAGYAQWGLDVHLRLNGMWAFALWDGRRQQLLLSRDRFGVKPMYYLADPRRFAFASELKAFRRLTGTELKEDTTALATVLSDPFALESTERTLLAGVRRVPAGHVVVVTNGQPQVRRWWRTSDHLPEPPADFDAQAEELRRLFFDACRIRSRSDVPIGTSLSGGLDSSSVLCTLAALQRAEPTERAATDWQRAFIASFPGTPIDEREYALAAAAAAGASPRVITLGTDIALESLHTVLDDFEEISFNLPTPQWSLYREQRRAGVIVTLDGHGADELLGGYRHQLLDVIRATGGIARHPVRTLDLVRTLRRMDRAQTVVAEESYLRHLLAGDPLLRRIARKTTPPSVDAGGAVVAGPWVRPSTDRYPPPQPDVDEAAAMARFGVLTRRLYHDVHLGSLPMIMRNFDRCSMAHGVEIRMPFMDWRLVTFLFALPDTSKVGDGRTKRVLREAMRGTVPEPLRLRASKIGFNSPLPSWLNGPLDGWLTDQVSDRAFCDSDLWDGRAIRDFVTSRRGALTWPDAERVWPFVHAKLWREHFVSA